MSELPDSVASFAPDVRVFVRRIFLLGSDPLELTDSVVAAAAALHREALVAFGPGRQSFQPEQFGDGLRRFLTPIAADGSSDRASLAKRLLGRLDEPNGEMNDLTKRRYLLSWDSGSFRSCDHLPDGTEPNPAAWGAALQLAKKLGLWTFIKSQEADSLPWFESQLASL